MRILAAALLFAVFSASPPAGEERLENQVRPLLDSQFFGRGDFDGMVRFHVSHARELPGSPLAELSLRFALRQDPAMLSSPGVGEAEARKLLAGNPPLSEELTDLARLLVARSLERSGKRAEAKSVHRQRGLAMAWTVAGPFSAPRDFDLNSPDCPAGEPYDPAGIVSSPPGPDAFRRWRLTPPRLPVPEDSAFPFVRPWRWFRGDGAMVMETAVNLAEADGDARIHIDSNVTTRLFIDGGLVGVVDRSFVEIPREQCFRLPLSAGRHSLALHCLPPAPGSAAGEPRIALRLAAAAKFSWEAGGTETGLPAPAARAVPAPPGYFSELSAAAEKFPALRTAYAFACLEQGMPDEAAWQATLAARQDPDDAATNMLAGRLTEDNPLLPPLRRRDMARGFYERTLRIKPDLVPGLIRMATGAMADGEGGEAGEFLDRARAVNPKCVSLALALGEWATRFAPAAAARAIWEDAARDFPASRAVQSGAALAASGFLDGEQLLACRRAAAVADYSFPQLLLYAEALAEGGETREALTVLRQALGTFAGDPDAQAEASGLYVRLGMPEEASDAMAEAIRLRPSCARQWRELGNLARARGDAGKAAAYWRVSLAADPGQRGLREMLDFLGDKSVVFRDDAPRRDAADLAAEQAGKSHPGDVVRLLGECVIDVAADGSFQRAVREVDIALTRQGAESLENLDVRGELLTARTLLPDGAVLEPESVPGGGMRLPAASPGSVREILYRESEAGGNGQPPGMGTWHFQDPEGKRAFLESECVVAVPEGFPLAYELHGGDGAVSFEKTSAAGRDVYRWKARLGPPADEPDAEHVSERTASVEAGSVATWDEVNFRVLRSLEGKLALSRDIRETAGSLMGSPAGSPAAAAESIYRFVCDIIDPDSANDMAAHTLADRMGDRSILLLALLRAAGMEAHPGAARPNRTLLHGPAWELPSREAFTVPLVRLSLPDGSQAWLDTRFDVLGFGEIPEDLSEATAAAFLPGGPVFETLPRLPASASMASEERMIRLPGTEGPLSVSGRSMIRGVEGLRRRQFIAGADARAREDNLLRHIFPVFPDAEITGMDVSMSGRFDVASVERYEAASLSPLERRPDGARAVSLCLAPPELVSPESRNMGSRKTVCHIRRDHIGEDRNIFILPEGAALTVLPGTKAIPSRFGLYQLRVSRQGAGGVEVARSYFFPAQKIAPRDWPDFLEVLSGIELAERQWLEYVPSAE